MLLELNLNNVINFTKQVQNMGDSCQKHFLTIVDFYHCTKKIMLLWQKDEKGSNISFLLLKET